MALGLVVSVTRIGGCICTDTTPPGGAAIQSQHRQTTAVPPLPVPYFLYTVLGSKTRSPTTANSPPTTLRKKQVRYPS